jgi:hypothetical protein
MADQDPVMTDATSLECQLADRIAAWERDSKQRVTAVHIKRKKQRGGTAYLVVELDTAPVTTAASAGRSGTGT